ncbi:MAG TPA: sugar phosphate isomerase/epimerase [Gemmataceae bacterium]|nr:sugar phosphate isomerase/epimerase [Gemmataceae bacterium]
MFVACSTLCFGRQPLAAALRAISELGFSKVDMAVREDGPHLKPSQVAADFGRAVQQLRGGHGLTIAALHLELADGLGQDETEHQVKAVCRLARVLTTPLVSLPAAAAATDVDAEVQRLTWLNRLARFEGVAMTVETRTGTLTEDPATALDLCRRVPGLGIALDPSHYLIASQSDERLDALYPYVQHVRLRDTSGKTHQFQVRIGQGEIEYGRIINQLARYNYQRLLSVDIRDLPDLGFEMPPEVRKLKYLLESLI